MELRARTRPMLRRAAMMAALPALLVPAVAGTTAAHAAKSPVVKRITPKNVAVGETLTIHGKHFRRGLNKNTVAFKRPGAKAVFVKAEKGTAKMLKVELPKRLEDVLVVRNGTPVPTRLQIRVLSTKFGKRYTSKRISPIVGAEKPPAPPKPPAVDPNGDCDADGVKNAVDPDDDGDLLSDEDENTLKLDSCNVDSDRDGAEDGFEYQSALDLNDDEHGSSGSLPKPLKKPYPNPLDKTDKDTDHDGDSLTLLDEHKLWKLTGVPTRALTYSAGEQYSARDSSGNLLPADDYNRQTQFLQWATNNGYANVGLANIGTNLGDTQAHWSASRTSYPLLDANRSGDVSLDEEFYFDFGSGKRDDLLDDAERDEDADGLSNYAETRGCMNRGLWDKLFPGEVKYPLEYSGTDLVDADTDGDDVRDGADDQDHDDVPNIMECNRLLAAGLDTNPDPLIVFLGEDARDRAAPRAGLTASGFVNPFNPCLPHSRSRTCRQYIEGEAWAPFGKTDKYYFIWD